LATLALVLLWAVPGSAQQYGQWWWEAEVGAGARTYENLVNDIEVSTYEERRLRLNLDVNGFILHPAVARFRLGIEGLLTRFEGVSQPDSTRLGYEGELKLFPRGRYVWWFLVRHAGYSYPDFDTIDGDDVLTVASLPDTTTTLRGQVRVRSGPLRGSTFAVERNLVDFLDPDADQQVRQRESFSWNGTGDMARNVRAERRYQEYGVVDFSSQDFIATFDQHGQINPAWRWDLTTIGNRRTIMYADDEDIDIYQLGVRNRMIYRAQNKDFLQLDAEGGMLRVIDSVTHSHDLSARYIWHTDSGWDLYPFVAYGLRSGDDETIHLPRLGGGVTRTFNLDSLSATVDATASYGLTKVSGDRSLPDSSFLGYAIAGSVSHGARFLKQLELSWNRDEITQDWQVDPDLPDLGASLQRGSTQDRKQARLSLSHTWRLMSVRGYSEWIDTQSSPEGPFPELLTESLTHSVTLSSKRFRLHLAAGDKRFQQATSQEISFQTAGLTVRPFPHLSVRATYRTDTRVLDYGPDVDGELIIAGLSFQLGAFTLDAEANQVTERLVTGSERINRTIIWSVRRRFAGWLPFVSAPQRRGTVQ
jgi:hypothetical protein